MSHLIPHAGLVHLPLALAAIIPLMYAMAWISVRKNWLNGNVWYGVIVFALLQLVSILIGIQSGEAAEFTSAASKDAVERHEQAAETFFFVWIGLAVLLISSPWLRKFNRGWLVDGLAMMLFAIQMYLAFSTGHLGGDLIPR